ncbi:MAG: hypothetical protein II768_04000 [Clostridia bacterium]|nr:hypothetical protein [Clostridia bacterium]
MKKKDGTEDISMNDTRIFVSDAVPTDGSRDVTADLQALIDANPNRTIYFPDGLYRISSPLCTPADPRRAVSLALADFAVIRAAEGWASDEAMIRLGGKDPYNSITINGSNYSLSGGIIDGAGAAKGVSIDSGRETAVRNVSIKHTKVGLHIKHGANSGSSDADITGVNIVGTGGTDSVGVLVEGYDNTLTNMRIANVFIGVDLRSAGNSLRNLHPLYTSDNTDYEGSCGFRDLCGNNWMNFCYSDQFASGFRLGDNIRDNMTDCFAFWYSDKGGPQTLIRCDGRFGSMVTNIKVGFKTKENVNTILRAEDGGRGVLQNLLLNHGDESWFDGDTTYRAYLRGDIL